VLIRHLWQLKAVVFLHWCLIRAFLLPLAVLPITLSLWFQVPVYWAAQYLGAFLAAASVFGVYNHSIYKAGGKGQQTRAIFGTYPNHHVSPSSLTLAFDEMLGTALLVNVVTVYTEQSVVEYLPRYLSALFVSLVLSVAAAKKKRKMPWKKWR